MKRLARFLARLYPRPWRDRYGREFDALLEDAPMRGADLFDLLAGALRMQFRNPSTWVRIGVFAAVGVIAGIGAGYAVKPEYLATAGAQYFFNGGDARNAYMQQMLSRRVLAELILGENLFAEERQRLPLEDIIYSVRRMIRLQGDGTSYRLEVLASGPTEARLLVEKLTYSKIAYEPVPVRPFLSWYAAAGCGFGLFVYAVNVLFKMRTRKSCGSVLF